jgi:hemerythrin-like metal-binding protein
MVVCTQEEAPMLDTVNRYHLQGTPTADILDRQHLQIKRQQQYLRTTIIIGTGMDQIVACAKNLIQTTIEHFKSEEGAMDAINFSGLGVHQLLHAEMIERAMKIWSDLEHCNISEAMESMKSFDERLTHHLDFEDGAFGSELSNIKK